MNWNGIRYTVPEHLRDETRTPRRPLATRKPPLRWSAILRPGWVENTHRLTTTPDIRGCQGANVGKASCSRLINAGLRMAATGRRTDAETVRRPTVDRTASDARPFTVFPGARRADDRF